MTDLNNFPKKVDELIFYLDDIEGNRLYKEIIAEEKKLIQGDTEKQGALIALGFLIIPFLSTREVGSLLKEDLYIGLSIDDIDLTERINKKLLFLDITDRDNCKRVLKTAILNNQEQITEEATTKSGRKLKTVNNWLKDYVKHIDQHKGSTLEEAQYFFQKSYFKKLDDDEMEMVKKLFDLYKFLNTSSLTPEGFEDDILIKEEDGRIVTTNKGQVVVLYDPNKEKATEPAKPKIPATIGTPKTATEKRIDAVRKKEEDYKEGSLEREALEEEEKMQKRGQELEYMVNDYPAGSLERKAIEEEIERLKG